MRSSTALSMSPLSVGSLNAAASLLISERVTTIQQGISEAGAALDSGQAATVLEKLVRQSNQPLEAAAS